MPDGHRNPTVEDYTSDENGETRRDAAKQASSTKQMPHLFHRNHRDAASDSGYSSHTSNTMSSTSHSQPASNLRPPPPPTQHAAPNVINRSDSQRHQSRPSRSASMSKPPPPCTDKHCDDPNCASKRGGGRYTLPLRPPSQQPPQHPQTTQYPVQETAPYSQAPNHSYAQVPHGQPVPNYGQQPQTRPHASSTSRSRPTSWAQAPGVPINYQYGMTPQANYNAQYSGLQGSPSTYNRSYLAHHPSASGDWSGMASGSPRDPSGLYMPGHGMPIPSNGQTYRPPMPHAYSARQAIPTVSSRDSLTPSTERAQPTVISARRRSEMPGSFPGEALHFESTSDTSSESSDSEEEERHRQSRRQRRREEKLVQTRQALEDRDRRAMPPPIHPREHRERRPTLTTTRTAPAETRRPQSRGPPQRGSRHSEPRFPPSEYVDLDRSARPAAEKRHTPSYEHPRQPSISHHQPSGRPRSGSISQESRVVQQYVVEDGKGRKTVYDTREEADAKARRLKQQQHLDAAEAYQATTPALTAESVKRAQTTHQRERRPASHVSGSSRKSTTSSARTGTESIQITRDGTTFSIPTNTTLQIRQTEEGEMWVIGSGSPPREHSYYGGSSKSSGSRVGGRRHGSEHGGRRRDTKTEDDGYEPRL